MKNINKKGTIGANSAANRLPGRKYQGFKK